MILNKYTNSSVLVVGAMCVLMNPSIASSSSIHNLPRVNNYTINQTATSTPKLINMNNGNIKSNSAYTETKRNDFMSNNNNKVKSVNVAMIQTRRDTLDDLGYFEYNEIDNLDIAPRKVVTIKATVKSIERKELKLI